VGTIAAPDAVRKKKIPFFAPAGNQKQVSSFMVKCARQFNFRPLHSTSAILAMNNLENFSRVISSN
jgi:hypothetical protein